MNWLKQLGVARLIGYCGYAAAVRSPKGRTELKKKKKRLEFNRIEMNGLRVAGLFSCRGEVAALRVAEPN